MASVAPAARFRIWLQSLARTARLMVGLPDYAAYVEHLRHAHPEQVPMTRTAFFRSRQDARYRRGSSRCC